MAIYIDIIKNMQTSKSEYSDLLDSLYNEFLLGMDIPDAADFDLEEMRLVLNLLLARKELTKNALYKNKLKTRGEKAFAVSFLSKVNYLKEIFDIMTEKTSLEEIRQAAKTLAPKMQSSFS